MVKLLQKQYILVIFIISLIATLGSLYYSEVEGLVPCTLCWYQRILMYPIALFSAAALIFQEKLSPKIILVASIPGLFLSLYHYLLQKTTIFGEFTACSSAIPCGAEQINYFGFMTIPFLALVAFSLISVVCIIAMGKERRAESNGH